MSNDQKPGIALLSLDGGSWENLGALTQIHIVEEILDQYEEENDLEPGSVNISDIFDTIIATGTVGPRLVACMLGPLGMSTEDAKAAYIRIHQSNILGNTQLSERAEALKRELQTLLDSHAGKVDGLNSTTQMTDIVKLISEMQIVRHLHPYLVT
ncbi:hypothetical protein DL96DRAFT_1721361 [Flagelloscypha sp. PMI_526]|nr:hypothetical protein DL96DRAFT_1721361 [Flagelloscypha sp. PMI_526]